VISSRGRNHSLGFVETIKIHEGQEGVPGTTLLEGASELVEFKLEPDVLRGVREVEWSGH